MFSAAFSAVARVCAPSASLALQRGASLLRQPTQQQQQLQHALHTSVRASLAAVTDQLIAGVRQPQPTQQQLTQQPQSSEAVSAGVAGESFDRTPTVPSHLDDEERKLFVTATRGGYHAARRGLYKTRSALWENRSHTAHASDSSSSSSTSASSSASSSSSSSSSSPPAREPELKTKRPMHSYRRYLLPFSSDESLRDQYINMYGDIRIGKLFEDLDAFAAELSYVHSEGALEEHPLTIVTASCDRIKMMNKLSPKNDLSIEGCVVHVGRSSMIVRVELKSVDKAGVEIPILSAAFTEVAKDRVTQKAASVHRLVPQSAQEKRMNEWAIEHVMRERNERQNDVGKSLPTADEFAMLHEIFTGSASGVSATSPGAEVVPMRDTHMSSTVIMFPQEKNVHNKIFGGFMMRQGFELAWGTAHVFAGSRPIFLASDDIVFRRPVPIGSIVVFDSHVACTEGETVQVSVQADVLDPTAGTRECTNTFQFTFRASAPLTRQVVPETYAEGMSYVRGRRIVGKLAHEPMGDSMFGDA